MARKKLNQYTPPAPSYPSEPLRRDIILVFAFSYDGNRFGVLLTRVPGIGEEVSFEGKTYRVMRVQHEPVDQEGRAEWGTHAYVYVTPLPEDEELPGEKPSRRRKKRVVKDPPDV